MKRRIVEQALSQEPTAPVAARRRSAQDDYLDEHGHERPDPTPVAPPVGHNRQPSLAEQIRSMVVSERLKQEAAAAGAETFEEADDFEVGDDYDPTSPYEEVFEPPLPPEPLIVRMAETPGASGGASSAPPEAEGADPSNVNTP